MPIRMDHVELPLEAQIFINDVVDFLKGLSPNELTGVRELQRRDLLHRASIYVNMVDNNSLDNYGGTNLEYAYLRKSAQMIGSLFLLDRQFPNVKQRTTAVIHTGKLILYHNGKNPQVPLLIIDLLEVKVIEGIELTNARFCLIEERNHTKHEFEALDVQERAEWVNELNKRANGGSSGNSDYDALDDAIEDFQQVQTEDMFEDSYGGSIYEEVGEARRIYDVPKSLENEAKSLTPPPPLPSRLCKSAAEVTEEDSLEFPPPPAFGDEEVVIIVPPPPPPPKPAKMIPPPPPPNSNKIQIFTKSISLNAITNPAKNKLKSSFRASSPATITTSNKNRLVTTLKSSSSGKSGSNFVEISNNNNSSSSSSKKEAGIIKHRSSELVFDEELKQKLERKKSSTIIDESALFEKNRGRQGGQSLEIETELEAILKKRREKSSSTPPVTRKTTPLHQLLHHEDFRKSASFRVNLAAESKFSTLPSRRPKPKLPDKKPNFSRGDSFKIQAWNRISLDNSDNEEVEEEEDEDYCSEYDYAEPENIQKSSLNLNYNDEDTTNNDDDDAVSDVDPEELQKMLEGMDFSDADLDNSPSKPISKNSSTTSVPLKSSIKSSVNGENPRKVQFSKDTKEDDLSELLESPGTKKPTVQLQQQQQLSNNTTAEVTTTTAITTKSNVHETGSNEGKGGGVGSLSTSSSSSTKVGHSNKSKVMHDLFGLEESPLKTNILQKPKESTEDQSMASSNNSLRRGRMEKSDDADDLFAGLDPPRPKTNPSTSAASRNDFMSSLFGGGGSKTNTASATSNPTKSRDFVLEEKYINPANNNITVSVSASSDISSAKPPTAAQRSRRGSPFMAAPNLPTASKTSDFDQPPSNSNFNFEPTSTVGTTSDPPTRLSTIPSSTVVVSSDSNVTEAMKYQSRQMEEFEKEQQTKFVKDLEDHKRQLDVQQAEHRNILDQQRSMAREQMKLLQEKQALALQTQQAQSQMLMKQLQSQMESEMKMKTELARNQMQILAEVQPGTGAQDLDEVIQNFSRNSGANGNGGAVVHVEEMYKNREERLKLAHADELTEMQKRIQHWIQRAQQMSEEHQKELDEEKERRRHDLHQQSEDHKATVETIRADYSVLVDKIKELKTIELEASVEARDNSKALDALLGQMTSNMDEVTNLRIGLEDRLSKHVDVREALMKKKDEQLQVLQGKLVKLAQENQDEQKLLRETIDKLQKQLTDKEQELAARESALRRQQDKVEENRRKFELEKEVTLERLREDRLRFQDQKSALEEERKHLHKAIEKEHRLIVTEKAKVAINNRLKTTTDKLIESPGVVDQKEFLKQQHPFRQHEIEAMIKAIEDEKIRVSQQWKSIAEAKTKLANKKQNLREDKKLIEDALRKMAAIDGSIDKKLSKVEGLVVASGGIRKECQAMTDECKSIEAARSKAIAEAKTEAVQRLEAVEREAQRLESIREATNRERRRLLHTRAALLCTRCQKPFEVTTTATEHSKELSNLGLRTAGDGETISSSLHQFASLRKDAQRDQDYLTREAHYLQSLANGLSLEV